MPGLARQRLGATDLQVSELCLGSANFGDATGAAESRRIIDAFLEAGGNFIDTADVYAGGAAEEIIGAALRGRREQVVIVTKTGMATVAAARPGGGSRAAVVAAVEASLRRLRTDRIELYLMHVPDPTTPQEETLAAFDTLIRDGKLRYAGLSNYAGWQLAKAQGIATRRGFAGIAALQAQYSLVSRDVELDLVPLCREEGIPLIAFAPLGGGVLSGKYDPTRSAPPGTRLAEQPRNAHPLNAHTLAIVEALRQVAAETGRSAAQVALRWIAARPTVASMVVGARNLAQLAQNIGIGGWSLSDEQLRALEKISRPRLPYPHSLQQMLACRPSL